MADERVAALKLRQNGRRKEPARWELTIQESRNSLWEIDLRQDLN